MRKNVLIVALVLLVALVSCADHEHAWSEWKVVEESTCTKAGSRTRTCIGCNEKETEKLPLKEHSYECNTVVEPNCVDTGSEEQVCVGCKAKGETREVEALGHEYGKDGKCTRCGNEQAKVEAAEARIGFVYYAKFEDAVHAAVKATKAEDKIVEVLKDKIDLRDEEKQHTPEINGSVTINANGADFENKCEIPVVTYNHENDGFCTTDDILIVINDAKNLYLWGQPGNKDGDPNVQGCEEYRNKTINITMNNCSNEGTSRTEKDGRLIYIVGTYNTVNITLNNCSVSKSDSPVYTNASGTIVIKDCTFTECAVPVNMNYKATEGTRRITIDGCTFTACGFTKEESTGSDLSEYAAPIRVLHTADGSDDCVTITNTSITGTVGTNGDVLLLAKHEDDSKIKAEKAILENNKTDIKVVYGKDEANVKTVKAGTSDTIEVVLPPAST